MIDQAHIFDSSLAVFAGEKVPGEDLDLSVRAACQNFIQAIQFSRRPDKASQIRKPSLQKHADDLDANEMK